MKAKVKLGVRHLCGHECERSSVSSNFNTKAKAKRYLGGNNFALISVSIRSRPGKPNQRKGHNEKFMNFAHFCEFWCFSLGEQARFILNFCSGTPLRKVHELTFLWFGLPGPLLSQPVPHFKMASCRTRLGRNPSAASVSTHPPSKRGLSWLGGVQGETSHVHHGSNGCHRQASTLPQKRA